MDGWQVILRGLGLPWMLRHHSWDDGVLSSQLLEMLGSCCEKNTLRMPLEMLLAMWETHGETENGGWYSLHTSTFPWNWQSTMSKEAANFWRAVASLGQSKINPNLVSSGGFPFKYIANSSHAFGFPPKFSETRQGFDMYPCRQQCCGSMGWISWIRKMSNIFQVCIFEDLRINFQGAASSIYAYY